MNLPRHDAPPPPSLDPLARERAWRWAIRWLQGNIAMVFLLLVGHLPIALVLARAAQGQADLLLFVSLVSLVLNGWLAYCACRVFTNTRRGFVRLLPVMMVAFNGLLLILSAWLAGLAIARMI